MILPQRVRNRGGRRSTVQANMLPHRVRKCRREARLPKHVIVFPHRVRNSTNSPGETSVLPERVRQEQECSLKEGGIVMRG